MQNRDIRITYQEYVSLAELPDEDRSLLLAAYEATRNAYAPYSNFHVGAAVKMANGAVVNGSNQENAAYPSGLCAERVALFAASSQYPGVAVKAIAITAHSAEFNIDYPLPPCGSCRQVMAEYQTAHKQEMRVILGSGKGKVLVLNGIESLLPLMFEAKDLGK